MGIFSSIMDKIFHRKKPAAPAPAPAATPAAAAPAAVAPPLRQSRWTSRWC